MRRSLANKKMKKQSCLLLLELICRLTLLPLPTLLSLCSSASMRWHVLESVGHILSW